MEGGVTSTKVVVCRPLRSCHIDRYSHGGKQPASFASRISCRLRSAGCRGVNGWPRVLGSSQAFLWHCCTADRPAASPSRTGSMFVTLALQRAAPTLASPEPRPLLTVLFPLARTLSQFVFVCAAVPPVVGAGRGPCRHNIMLFSQYPLPQAALARHSPPTHATLFSEHGAHGDLACVCLRGSKVECNLPRTRAGESRPRACCHHHRHNDTHLRTSSPPPPGTRLPQP